MTIDRTLFAPQSLVVTEPMLTIELPQQTRGVDAAARPPDKPFRRRPAARPCMPPLPNGVEHHVRATGATRVRAAHDVRRHQGIDGVRRAPIPPGPVRGPYPDGRKPLWGYDGLAAVIWREAIGSPMKRDHRYRSSVCTPVPWG